MSEVRWTRRIKTAADAAGFIDAVDFCLLFPVQNVALPSLYYAMARRIPITWDKYTAKLWKWKDDLPRKHQAFYAKHFKSRGAFISLKLLLHFLATLESAAAPKDGDRFYSPSRRPTPGRPTDWN